MSLFPIQSKCFSAPFVLGSCVRLQFKPLKSRISVPYRLWVSRIKALLVFKARCLGNCVSISGLKCSSVWGRTWTPHSSGSSSVTVRSLPIVTVRSCLCLSSLWSFYFLLWKTNFQIHKEESVPHVAQIWCVHKWRWSVCSLIWWCSSLYRHCICCFLVSQTHYTPGVVFFFKVSSLDLGCSNGRKWRETKEPLDKGERGDRKSWLETRHSKNYDHGTSLHAK